MIAMDEIKTLWEWVSGMLALMVMGLGYFIRRIIIRQDAHDERLRHIEREYVSRDVIDTQIDRLERNISKKLDDQNAALKEDLQYIRSRLDNQEDDRK